jgi:hypothetical protein
MMISVEQSVELLAGEIEILGGNCLSAASATINPTEPDSESHSDRRGGKPATNSLSYSRACTRISFYNAILFFPSFLKFEFL